MSLNNTSRARPTSAWSPSRQHLEEGWKGRHIVQVWSVGLPKRNEVRFQHVWSTTLLQALKILLLRRLLNIYMRKCGIAFFIGNFF